jgi:hypothetical protein
MRCEVQAVSPARATTSRSVQREKRVAARTRRPEVLGIMRNRSFVEE